jgi:hypothetical protein
MAVRGRSGVGRGVVGAGIVAVAVLVAGCGGSPAVAPAAAPAVAPAVTPTLVADGGVVPPGGGPVAVDEDAERAPAAGGGGGSGGGGNTADVCATALTATQEMVRGMLSTALAGGDPEQAAADLQSGLEDYAGQMRAEAERADDADLRDALQLAASGAESALGASSEDQVDSSAFERAGAELERICA